MQAIACLATVGHECAESNEDESWEFSSCLEIRYKLHKRRPADHISYGCSENFSGCFIITAGLRLNLFNVIYEAAFCVRDFYLCSKLSS